MGSTNIKKVSLKHGDKYKKPKGGFVMKNWVMGILVGIVTLTLAACGGTTPPPVASFTLTGASVTIIQGTNGTATITINRTNFTEAITFTQGGLPAGVTGGSFTPPSTTGNSSQIALNVANGATAGSNSITITGTATGGMTKTAIVTLTVAAPATITVSGKIVDLFVGLPLAGVSVKIAGGTALTDSQGKFTIAGVTTPYDVAFIRTGGQAVIYKGLSKADPTLTYFSFPIAALKTATVTGNVSPGPYAGRVRQVAFDSPDLVSFGATTVGTNAVGNYTRSLSWRQGTPSVDIHALIFQRTAGLVSSYQGYGNKLGVNLADGATINNQNITLTGVTQKNISGNIIVPSGYTLGNKRFAVSFGNRAQIALHTDPSATLAFNYKSPEIPGATMTLNIAASKGPVSSTRILTGLAADANGLSINIPSGSEQILPVNAATNRTNSSEFSWTAFDSGVYLITFTGPRSYAVVTKATSTTIPDLSSLGFGLPNGAAYSWNVVGLAPYASINDAATGNIGKAFFGLSTGATSNSGNRTFSTAP